MAEHSTTIVVEYAEHHAVCICGWVGQFWPGDYPSDQAHAELWAHQRQARASDATDQFLADDTHAARTADAADTEPRQ